MKVKITKCDSDNFWYHDRVGETFDVILESPPSPLGYKVENEVLQCGEVPYIQIDDCCVVKEEPDQQMTELFETVCDYLDYLVFSLKERINYEQSHLDALEREKNSKLNYENENIAFVKGKITAYNKVLSDVEFSREMIKGEFYRQKISCKQSRIWGIDEED